MPIHELKEQIARLPEQPGVYLYFNAAGETIYVGKARSLRDRVRTYLGAHGSSPKTDALLDDAARLEVIVTDDGVGLPPGFDVATTPGLGTSIVHALVTGELAGSITMEAARDGQRPGTRVRVRIPVPVSGRTVEPPG